MFIVYELHVSALIGPSSSRRPDDGPIRAETCSLVYNKHVLDVKWFYNYFNDLLSYMFRSHTVIIRLISEIY